MQEIKIIRKLLGLLSLYPWAIPSAICLGFFASLAEGLGISLFVPFLQSLYNSNAISSETNSPLLNMLNGVFNGFPEEYRVYVISASILASIIIKNGFMYGNTALSAWLYMHINHNLICQAYRRLLTIRFDFLDSHDSGKFLNTINTQTWRACEAVNSYILYMTGVLTIIVFAGLLVLTSLQLTVYVVVILSCVSLMIQQLNRRIRQMGRKTVETSELLSKCMVEGFQGMRLIRAFNREDYEEDRLTQASIQNRNAYLKLELVRSITGPLSEVFSVIILITILVVGVHQKLAGLPVLLTFIVILYSLQPRIKQLESNRANLASLAGAVEDVRALVKESASDIVSSGHVPFKSLKESIYFKSVSFRYPFSTTPSLSKVSITIPKNQTTAIVGPSGAGKSTIVGLICRFYEATDGEIYIDGSPLVELDISTWRRRIAVVSQDIFMFSDSIRENIAYGRLDATEEEIIKAAQQAFAHDFISRFPQGYSTPVGERGVRLSGGQRQRLALARAIIRDPEILILDEATNALDSESEQMIQAALRTISQNRTVIIVAHRLSTIQQANQILVLEAGKVVEQGSFHDLLAKNGLFSRLYHLQYRPVV